MNVIVVGCGRMGAELAYGLYQQGNQVVVIDQNTNSFDNLHPNFRGRTIEGDGLAQDVLNRAGIEEADGLAAVTDSDVVNAVVAHVARIIYHVSKVIVRNYDARWQSLHDAFGAPVVSSTVWGARRIEELLHHDDVRVVFSVGNGEVSLYEFVTPESCQGCTLQELFPEDRCRMVAVTRAGHAMLPSDELQLEAGDVIHLSATPANMTALRSRLKSMQEG
jgi:trk system potassium uptake protein TrkA